ncbi:MAG TPA: YdaU family protein [Steroidobacteraceae bacterium]|jgi:uncharacterized protein YdaU (DUF1376 family)|nr:YdaU family protein [Steroidobacteraceae bacterium]
MSFAYLPLFTGDYLRDTRMLSPLKHGVYLLLLMYCWDTKSPVPLEEQDAAGIANCRSTDEIDALRYVLRKYFTCLEDGWYNERMQDEIATAEFVSKKRSEAGKKGAEARIKHRKIKNVKQVPGKSQASGEHLPVPPTPYHTNPRTKEKHPPDLPVGFGVFWARYPHFPQRSSRAESLRRWHSMKLEPIVDDVMRALAACLAVPQWTRDGRAFVSAAEVWLRKRLWEQDLVAVTDSLIESIAADPRCQ